MIPEDRIQVEISQDEEDSAEEVEEESSQVVTIEDMIKEIVVVVEKTQMVPTAELSLQP